MRSLDLVTIQIDKINIQEITMTIETGAAVSKQKLIDLKVRLLALKEHL